MFQHLLVPLDGTQLSEAVLPMVAFLARGAGAKVTLLHVVERDAPARVHGDHHLTTADEAENYLRHVAEERLPKDLAVERHVHRREIRDVAHSLADHAEEFEPDLIVMAAHGPRRLRQWLFGRVAQQVFRQTPTPLLLLKPGEQGGGVAVPFRRILVPLDGREEHQSALSGATGLARLSAAPLHLLMAVPTRSALVGADAATGALLPAATQQVLDMAQEQGVEYLAAHIGQLRAQGLEALGTVARGEPADVIAEIAARSAADLVALGTHGSAGLEAFWSGSLGQRLLDRLAASFFLAPACPADR